MTAGFARTQPGAAWRSLPSHSKRFRSTIHPSLAPSLARDTTTQRHCCEVPPDRLRRRTMGDPHARHMNSLAPSNLVNLVSKLQVLDQRIHTSAQVDMCLMNQAPWLSCPLMFRSCHKPGALMCTPAVPCRGCSTTAFKPRFS